MTFESFRATRNDLPRNRLVDCSVFNGECDEHSLANGHPVDLVGTWGIVAEKGNVREWQAASGKLLEIFRKKPRPSPSQHGSHDLAADKINSARRHCQSRAMLRDSLVGGGCGDSRALSLRMACIWLESRIPPRLPVVNHVDPAEHKGPRILWLFVPATFWRRDPKV